MAQTLIVGVLVVYALAYCVWYLLPARLKTRFGRVGKALGGASGCGSCSDCGKCAAPSSKPKTGQEVTALQPVTFHRKVDKRG